MDPKLKSRSFMSRMLFPVQYMKATFRLYSLVRSLKTWQVSKGDQAKASATSGKLNRLKCLMALGISLTMVVVHSSHTLIPFVL